MKPLTISLTHLIPVYNTSPHHLIECVASIRNQDANPILIVDDGSTQEETKIAVRAICEMYDSVSFQRLEQNHGTPTALNVGHSMIDTEYVALMGSSDIALPGKYEAQIEALLKWPNIDVLGTGLTAFRDSDPFRKPIFTFEHRNQPKPGDKKNHDHFFIVNHGTVIYRNSLIKKHLYNKDYKRGQDVELWSRLWSAGAVFRNIEKVYYLWRR